MPSSFVTVGHVVPRSVSVAVTLAPATAAPDGSVTRPVIPAVTACDQPAAGASSKIEITASKGVKYRARPGLMSLEETFLILTLSTLARTPDPCKAEFSVRLKL